MSWIRVDEASPPENTVVLVCDNIAENISLGVYVAAKEGTHGDEPGYYSDGYFSILAMGVKYFDGDSLVTHWMSLPDLPRVELDEDEE
jgi:Protein of unknown function (DUF551)